MVRQKWHPIFKIFSILVSAGLLLTGCGLVRFENTQVTIPKPEASITGTASTGEVTAQPTETTASSTAAQDTTQPAPAVTTSQPSEPVVTDPAESLPADPGNPVPEETPPIEVIRRFATTFPGSIVVDLKYSQYTVFKDYVLLMSGANIRELPDTSANIVSKGSYFEKLEVLSEVKGQYVETSGTDTWYEVQQEKDGQTVRGYILSTLAELRTFQFEKMVASLNSLKAEVDHQTTAYIANYKNANGAAPYHQGKTVDAFGVKRYQSAPAYYSASTESDFRYIPDGNLVTIVGQTETFFIIKTLNFAGEYHIPKRYVSLRNSIDQLTQAIVVDRKNQNEGVFEYIGNQWHMISYIYATTGEKAKYKEPTDLGYYMAIDKLNRFLYLDDITRQIAGYAPYAIRFGGGAYVHGVPVDVKIVNEVKVFPAMKEYLSTIGTIPRSHKCVRNYTSHAKFLFDWSVIGQTAVIVIE